MATQKRLGGNVRNAIPTEEDKIRQVLQTVENIFDQAYVERAFEDLSIPQSKIIGGVGTNYFTIGGNGSFYGNNQAAIPGNARGANALDVQSYRGAGTQVASGLRAIAIGERITASGPDSIAFGKAITMSGDTTVALGAGIVDNGSNYSIAIGSSPVLSGNNSIAIGHQASTGGIHGIAIGYLASAAIHGFGVGYFASAGNYGVAIGYNAASPGNGVAIGSGAVAAQYSSNVAIGYNATTYGALFTAAVAIGHGARATLNGAVGIGYGTNCAAGYAVAIGPYASTYFNASGSIALGWYATIGTGATNAVAIGQNVVNNTANSVRIGPNNTNVFITDNTNDATNTAIQIFHNGSVKRVSVGASDSGGAGYRLLRVAN